jgi:hypothetical protein
MHGTSINKESNSTPILLRQGTDPSDDNENEPVNYKEIRERKRDERGTRGGVFLPYFHPHWKSHYWTRLGTLEK